MRTFNLHHQKPITTAATAAPATMSKANKYSHLIAEQWDEGEDGYWIGLIAGWEVDDCVCIHEATKKKALARLPDARQAKAEAAGAPAK